MHPTKELRVSDSKELPLYQYNLLAGMEPAEAARSARHITVISYAISLSLFASVLALGSFAFVLYGPGSENTTASERLVSVGLILIGGLIGLAFFPIRAKDVYVWICYGVIMALAVAIAVIGFLL